MLGSGESWAPIKLVWQPFPRHWQEQREMRKHAFDKGRPTWRSALMGLMRNMAIRHKLVLVIMVTCLSPGKTGCMA